MSSGVLSRPEDGAGNPLCDISALPRAALDRMRAAGEEVRNCMRVLEKTNDNLVGEVLKTADAFYQWDHYPPGDVYDHETHSQYYYHAHDPDDRDMEEHGHFHTFLRPKGMPADARPAPLKDVVLPEGENEALSHLVCISMDSRGVPIRLFTTNRWVTGETWYAADDVVRMLDRFNIDVTFPSWATNRWLTAMVALFRPQIVWLLGERDRAVADWERQHPGGDTYEDRGLEVTSELPVSIDDQIAAVEAALKA
jgi:hypothetical protein